MNARYAQKMGEDKKIWLARIYKLANEEAGSKGGWMHVDPELLVILLNNMADLLPKSE